MQNSQDRSRSRLLPKPKGSKFSWETSGGGLLLRGAPPPVAAACGTPRTRLCTSPSPLWSGASSSSARPRECLVECWSSFLWFFIFFLAEVVGVFLIYWQSVLST